eukprot:GHUV01042704.1.p1 GENE.GHUV01042704.1~~GHUV01042704.1.p1  ORF type:complete len:116 (-),score=21.99 GHUV01042704.1:187-534(-)
MSHIKFAMSDQLARLLLSATHSCSFVAGCTAACSDLPDLSDASLDSPNICPAATMTASLPASSTTMAPVIIFHLARNRPVLICIPGANRHEYTTNEASQCAGVQVLQAKWGQGLT